MPHTNSPSGLIVPVDLVAFCVNEKDAHDATPHFAGANTVFINQLEKYPAFLGANINRDFTQSPWQPMEAGIHLHWALPDGLTKAKTSTGSLVFYPAPNRWLVSRFLLHKDGAVKRTSWIVLSDKLNDRLPQEQKSITLPVHPTKTTGQNYQYCGEWQAFDPSWLEPKIEKERLFANQTGLELSAVSSGQVSFASFYPNCRGVFGFVDLLKDIKLPSGGQVELMYQVTGWFSNSNNDPIKATPTLTDIQKKYGWTFKQEPGDKAPDYSLYYGIVQSVIWHPSKPYLEPCSPNLPEVKLDLSIGNNPAETLSAFLKEQNHPDIPYFETLLNAYFQGLLNALQDPAPDQLATMEETLQEREFSAIEAEYLYSVVKKTMVDGAEQFIEVVDLPPGLGDALNRLNQCAQQYQRLQARLNNEQWQLFADWYRIFLANQQSQQASYDIAYKKYNKLNDDVQTLLSAAKEALDKQQQAVVSQLPTGCELRQAPAPRYWQPAEPVILLSGDALPPMERYGGDGRFSPDGNLVCRLTDHLLDEVTANGVTVTSAKFEDQNIPAPKGPWAPDIFTRLLREACLLNTTLLKITKQDMENALLGKGKSPITFAGLPPSPVGVNWWDGNPWLPLFAAWTVKFQPLFATTDTNHTKLFDYPADFFTRRFHIDIDDGAYVEYQPESIPDPKKFEQTYKGSAVLTTSPITSIIRQLEKSGDDASKDLLKELKKPMLMQSISGINAAFLMHQQDVQLNIGVPPGTDYDDFTNAIADAVGVAGQTAPDFNGYFNPIRAGFFTLDLVLIDVFGQKKHVNSTRVNIAQSMTTFYKKKDNKQAAPGIVYLQPRLASPARLLLRWVAADSGGLDEMNPHPATTPICGWLLPNHVDDSLFLYNAQGKSLGTLFLNGDKREIRWQSAPGSDATIDQPIETVMAHENPYLKELALALKNGTPQFFIDFARAIDQVNASVNPPSDDSSNALSVLVGRPLALAQVSLGLELRGGPPYNQSWSVLSLDDGQYPYNETDNGFTQVNFPVVLGNLTKLNDGLIGYFKQNGNPSAYDLSTFYTSGARPSSSRKGVIRPEQNDLLLTPYPPANLPVDDEKTYTRKVLTLLDPRAALHASTGILPTKSITIPPYMYTDTLRLLEMTFMCLPVLRGQSALHLPLPLESGYEWSWVQEQKVNGTPEWVVTPDVASPAPIGLWTYTPQTLIEGWLRLNPKLLPDQPDQ